MAGAHAASQQGAGATCMGSARIVLSATCCQDSAAATGEGVVDHSRGSLPPHAATKHSQTFSQGVLLSRAASLEAGGADLAYLSGSHPNPAEI